MDCKFYCFSYTEIIISKNMKTWEWKQMTTWKSFEYALLIQFEEKLKDKTNVKIIQNSSLSIAKNCFNAVTPLEKSEYLIAASFAVNFLIDIEPRLSNDLGKSDILELEIVSDDKWKIGDVRDVLAIRALQKWEIGVSAKNNHMAVKHSRLSPSIDFWKDWLGKKVSENYFDEINPIFDKLRDLKNTSNWMALWRDLWDHHSSVYIPILNAFMKELTRLYEEDRGNVSRNLISYLVWNKDFYKVIKKKNIIEIHAYNINWALNQNFNNIEPKYKTPLVALPTIINSIWFKENSKTTIEIHFDNEWSLSLRIHNASSRIETSLKFDIQLINSPKSLYKNTLNIIHSKSWK